MSDDVLKLRPSQRQRFPDHGGPWCPFCGSRTLLVSRWSRDGGAVTVAVCYRPGEVGACVGEFGWRWTGSGAARRIVPGDRSILGGPHDNPAVTSA